MTALVYANAHSLFDYSNGASRSLLLLLETCASSGLDVYVITSCTSYSLEGYLHTKNIWESKRNESQSLHPLIHRFELNGVNHSLIFNDSYSRENLDSISQELVYRETEYCLDNLKRQNQTTGFLSWGNLLLEESLFRTAKRFGFRTFFYLANPSYIGMHPSTFRITDHFFTDSNATKCLYASEIKNSIQVLPKIVEPCSKLIPPNDRWSKKSIYFINPSLKKGLQYVLELAYHYSQLQLGYKFVFVDCSNNLNDDLKKLRLPSDKLPDNIMIIDGNADIDHLFSDATIILLLSIWHESGSRLILEGHQRGIPVLAFSTGGTSEFMQHVPQDLFNAPDSTTHWDYSALCMRINQLLSNSQLYAHHSMFLSSQLACSDKSNRDSAISIIHQSLTESSL